MREIKKEKLLMGIFVLIVFYILDSTGIIPYGFPGAVAGVFFTLLF